MEIIHAFGIDYRILIAQLVNFAILFFVLYKFGYRPIFAFLDERKKKIEDGIRMAEAAKEKIRDAEDHQSAIIAEAKKKAAGIVMHAEALARKRSDEVVEHTKKELALLAVREREAIRAERDKIARELTREVADLAALGMEKIAERRPGLNGF